MTYSICAICPETGHVGVAVASRFFAAGAVVPHLRRTCAVASQAFASPLWGIEMADRLAAGDAPAAILGDLASRDAGQAQRQIHGVGPDRAARAHTGGECVPWAGHAGDQGVSVAGNMLAGPEVVAETLAAFQDGAGMALPQRLLHAMRAGEAAGGDKRGRQSACIRVHRHEDFPWLDIRADDHADPLGELDRLLDVASERYLHMADVMPSTVNPSGVADRPALEARIAQAAAERGGRPTRSAATPLG